MLDELLRGFSDGLAPLSVEPGAARDVVADVLPAPPNPVALAADEALRGRRSGALFALNKARTDVANARAQPPSADEVYEKWNSMVEDPDLAFFRWFPAAFTS